MKALKRKNTGKPDEEFAKHQLEKVKDRESKLLSLHGLVGDIDRKKTFLLAYLKSGGMVERSCKEARVTPAEFYHWMENDKAFAANADLVDERLVDLAQSVLKGHLAKNNLTAAIYLTKTKGKKRGYVEKLIEDGREKKEAPASVPVLQAQVSEIQRKLSKLESIEAEVKVINVVDADISEGNNES